MELNSRIKIILQTVGAAKRRLERAKMHIEHGGITLTNIDKILSNIEILEKELRNYGRGKN